MTLIYSNSKINFENLDIVSVYKEVTEKHGPSQALIDFINFDGLLSEEIGLETFDSLSTQAQHEILIGNLDGDESNSTALEGLYEKIDIFGKILTGSGVATLRYLPNGNPALINKGRITGFLASLTGLTILFINDKLHEVVIPFSFIAKIKEGSHKALELDRRFYSQVPKNFDPKGWKDFYKNTIDPDSKFAEDYEKWMVKYDIEINWKKLVPLKESGWTPEKVGDFLKWYGEITSELAKSATSMEPTFTKIKQWVSQNKSSQDPEVRETIKYIKRTLKYAEYTHMSSYQILSEVKKIVKLLLKRVKIEKQ